MCMSNQVQQYDYAMLNFIVSAISHSDKVCHVGVNFPVMLGPANLSGIQEEKKKKTWHNLC